MVGAVKNGFIRPELQERQLGSDGCEVRDALSAYCWVPLALRVRSQDEACAAIATIPAC